MNHQNKTLKDTVASHFFGKPTCSGIVECNKNVIHESDNFLLYSLAFSKKKYYMFKKFEKQIN